jgi:sigma-B regulation protein RsbU (phosphoserine phosphatase)
VVPSQVQLNNLRWESQAQSNFGAEFNLFNDRLFWGHLPPETRSFLVYLESDLKSGLAGARIVARQYAGDDSGRAWEAPGGVEYLQADNANQNQLLLNDFKNRISAVRRGTYEGCDCLWVYGPLAQDGVLVLLTPYAEIVKPASRAEDTIQSEIHELLVITRYGMFGVLLVVVLLAFTFSRSVSKPLQILADGARRLSEGDFDARVDIRSGDEFGEMGRVFNSVGPQLNAHYKLRQALDVAMEIQQNLLPQTDPRVPGLDIAGRSLYCEETGGDYYDYLTVDGEQSGKIGVVVGDVSGHGISSALLMTTARALLRQRAAMPGGVEQIIADVNRQLSKDVHDSGQFMTLFFCEFNLPERSICWVRAGHDPALVYDPASDVFDELVGEGLALGVSDRSTYECRLRKAAAGNIVAIGTDGIWEARNAQGSMFGKDKMREIIRRHAAESANQILSAVVSGLEQFLGPDHKKEDDVTLVIAKFEI